MYCTAAIRGLKPKEQGGMMERHTSGEMYATPACDADNNAAIGEAGVVSRPCCSNISFSVNVVWNTVHQHALSVSQQKIEKHNNE